VQKGQAILPIGTVLNGQYIVESLLGKGGFGNVYLARHQRDKQKLYALAELINPQEQEGYRFTLHYVLPPPLHHRALLRAQDGFTDDTLGRTCLLVSYSEEPHLEMLRLQQPEQRFPLPQVMTLIAPIMSAVSHLHHQHPPVLHQNIKPASMIVPRTTGEPVLVMLRIVKEQGSTTNPLPYFAPCYGAIEQYSGEVSTRTDIYGLGATFYILLTGIVPPDALYRSTQVDRTGIDLLKPVNEVVPTIPPFTADAIQQAMALEDDHRFSSVEQFWEALGSPWREFSPAISRRGSTPLLPPPVTPKQAVTRQAPISAPRLPQASRSWKLGSLWPFARKPTAEQPAPVHEPLRSSRSWRLGILLCGFLALCIVLIVGVSLWSHATAGTPAHPVIVPPRHTAPAGVTPATQPPGTPPTFPTTPVSGLPSVARSYQGTIHNTPADVTSTMSLTNIKRDGGKVSGQLALGRGLLGDGFFTGTVDTARRIQFTVPGVFGNAPLQFSGIAQADGSLKGSYCSLDQTNHCNPAAGGYGTWNVQPAKAGRASSPWRSTSAPIASSSQGRCD
jgi:serine/threonine protein kinase